MALPKVGCCGRAEWVQKAFLSLRGGTQNLLLVEQGRFSPEHRELAEELHSSAERGDGKFVVL